MIFDNLEAALLKRAAQTEEEHKAKDREYQQKKRDAERNGIILNPHQLRVHDKLRKSPGLLVYHGLGSGKTITSITAADALGLDAEAVVPAALRSNYAKELAKVKPLQKFHVKSYEGFAKNPTPHGKLLVFDEVQRLQDPSSQRTLAAAEHGPKASKRLGLSGTPIQNHPAEMASLFNVLAGKRVLPGHDDFTRKFIKEETVHPGFINRYFRGIEPGIKQSINNKADLAGHIRGLVDYHPSAAEGFPSTSTSVVETPMSNVQEDVYNHVTQGNRSFWNKVERNLPPSKRESKNLNAFLSGARQASNTPAPFRRDATAESSFDSSPKMQRVVSDIEHGVKTVPNFKSVVYSNYLGAGVHPVAKALAARGISAHVFTGGMSDKARKGIVEDFNSGKVKTLLISGAGAEGLDLKGTRMVQVMEPHWNESRIKQVVGRAVRYKSHEHLPSDQRNVDVRHYHATRKPGFMARLFGGKPKTSADQYIGGLAKKKQELIDQFLDVMKTEGSRP